MKRYYVVVKIGNETLGFVTKPMKFFRPFDVLLQLEKKESPESEKTVNIIYHHELTAVDEVDFENYSSFIIS